MRWCFSGIAADCCGIAAALHWCCAEFLRRTISMGGVWLRLCCEVGGYWVGVGWLLGRAAAAWCLGAPALGQAAGDFGYELLCQIALAGAGQLGAAVGINQQQGVVVLPKGGCANVTSHEWHLFAQAFGDGVFAQVLGFGSKANAV